jgi:hypothetical protein
MLGATSHQKFFLCTYPTRVHVSYVACGRRLSSAVLAIVHVLLVGLSEIVDHIRV